MNISAYHIQNVIRSYSQRMGRKDQLAQKRADATATFDTISISDDGKKAQLTAQLTGMIAHKNPAFMNDDKKEEAEFAKRLMERLGSENGGQIESSPDQKQRTGFRFKIIDAAKEETIKELSLEDVKTAIGKLSSEIQT
jgi:hypothetical protein